MTRADLLNAHREAECDGDRSPQGEGHHVELVERLCAADLVLAMRQVRSTAPHWDEMTRERFARQFESQAVQFSAAAAHLRRHRADVDVPEWLKEGGL